MKRILAGLMTFVCCFIVLAVHPASADTHHVSENLYAPSDYLIFSPEYSDSKGQWELWVLAYKTGKSNYSGKANYELDQCVSASLLSVNNPPAAAGTISALFGEPYYLEDMMEEVGIRYYEFIDFHKKCYLASPGGELTTVAPIETIEIQDTRESKRFLFESKGSRPGFMLLCQLWRFSSQFGQIPSEVTKTFGMDTPQRQTLYSNRASDYCSNQDKLQKYCDSLIPEVSYVSSGDTSRKLFASDVYYGRKNVLELSVSPTMEGLNLIFTAGLR